MTNMNIFYENRTDVGVARRQRNQMQNLHLARPASARFASFRPVSPARRSLPASGGPVTAAIAAAAAAVEAAESNIDFHRSALETDRRMSGYKIDGTACL